MTDDNEYQKVSLANLASGAAIELADAELTRIYDNIADENTKCKVARKMVLEVTIIPTDDRSIGMVSIKASSKLAAMDPRGSAIEFVQEGRKQVAYQRSAKQQELPFDKKPVAMKGV